LKVQNFLVLRGVLESQHDLRRAVARMEGDNRLSPQSLTETAFDSMTTEAGEGQLEGTIRP
jgi:hypothetical protein